jgi:hypothetical protein
MTKESLDCSAFGRRRDSVGDHLFFNISADGGVYFGWIFRIYSNYLANPHISIVEWWSET